MGILNHINEVDSESLTVIVGEPGKGTYSNVIRLTESVSLILCADKELEHTARSVVTHLGRSLENDVLFWRTENVDDFVAYIENIGSAVIAYYPDTKNTMLTDEEITKIKSIAIKNKLHVIIAKQVESLDDFKEHNLVDSAFLSSKIEEPATMILLSLAAGKVKVIKDRAGKEGIFTFS